MKRTIAIILAIAIISITIQFEIENGKAQSIEDLVINGTNETIDKSLEVKNIFVKNNGTLTLKNLTVRINGDVFVEKNSSLILNSVELIMNSTDKEIRINNSANLIILGNDNKITSPNNYTFKIYGMAEISNATIENITRGVEIYSDFVNITKTIIQKNQLQGIYIDSSTPKVSYTEIRNNMIGILLRNSSPKIENCNITENYRGIYLINSNAIIKNSNISNNKEDGLYIENESNLQFINNIIEKNNRGIRLTPFANSSFTILNSSFIDNGDTVYFDANASSYLYFLNTTISSKAPPFIFIDSISSVKIGWYLKIKVKNWEGLKQNEGPRIILKDNYNKELYNLTSNSLGESLLIEVIEKNEGKSSFESYNPHKIFISIGKIEVNKTINVINYKEEIVDIKSYFGIIRGFVKLENRTNADGITIELLKNGTKIDSKTTTENGSYIFEFVSPGIYTISANYTNYSTQRKEINVSPGKEVWWNLTLKKEQEPIVVEEKKEETNIPIIMMFLLLILITIIVYYYSLRNEKRLKEKLEERRKKK